MKTHADQETGDILTNIVQWSRDLPGWQRDALRRIIVNGDVDDRDLAELVEICEVENDLPAVSEIEPIPVTLQDIPAQSKSQQSVAIAAISNIENVNAIDRGQVLTFAASGLTVVFGYNGSGKSGYGRILRRACRARNKSNAILPNVMNPPATKGPASAEFITLSNGVEQPIEQWIDGIRPVETLARVSFFDADCASVHVRNKNDIAFTPYGMDILPKLGSACSAVQTKLDAKKKLLEADVPQFLKSKHAVSNTAVGMFLKGIRHDANIEQLERLASLTDQEKESQNSITLRLSVDPEIKIKELRVSLQKLQELNKRIQRSRTLLSPQAISEILALVKNAFDKQQAAEIAAKMDFLGDATLTIGTDAWRNLWEAARNYSTTAYPDQQFPVVTDDAVCLLCQQSLPEDTKLRLSRFEEFVKNDTAIQARNAATAIDAALKPILLLGLSDEIVVEQLRVLQLQDPDTALQIKSEISLLQKTVDSMALAHRSNDWANFVNLADYSQANIESVEKLVQDEITRTEGTKDVAQRGLLQSELSELQAREWLATVLGDVKSHINDLKTIHKLTNCLKQTRPVKITNKSKELAKTHVSDQLRDAFATEIRKLEQGVRRLNVELSADSGGNGSVFFRVQLVRASKAEIGAVVSEGEHRCIALAGFLSELCTESSGSAIVFDDPVTSLDHQWRGCFARRLVEESKNRQVIVFTHDIVFLHDLLSDAEQLDATIALRRVQSTRDHSGVVSDGLPWIAQKTLPRINELQNRARATRQDYDAQNDDVYDRDICGVYSDLRATIERAVEEHLFQGVVTRHQDYINLGKLRKTTVLTTIHCERLQKLFKRCCDITSAHDRAALRSFGVPKPDEALSDIDELKALVDEIKDLQKLIV